MDPLEGFGDCRAHAEEEGALGGPVSARAHPVVLAADHDGRHTGLAVAHRGIVDVGYLTGGMIRGSASLGAGGEEVSEPDVGEGAAHHHLVVSTTAAVGVEVLLLHAPGDEIAARGAVGIDGAGGTYVVGRGRIACPDQHARAVDRPDRRDLGAHAGKEIGLADVGAVLVPVVEGGLGHVDVVPLLVGGFESLVALDEGVAVEGLLHVLRQFLIARPQVLEVDGRAVLAVPHRLVLEIDADVSGEGVGHDQRR